MKKAVVIMSLVFVFAFSALASHNVWVPRDIADYAQSLCDGQIADIIEDQFSSNKDDAHIYRNSKSGDDYHLSEPKKIYNISGDVDISGEASMKISSIMNEVKEGYFYTVDNSADEAVVILEMCRESDGKPGFGFGDDAYFFQKCYRLMNDLMKKDGSKAEPLIIDDITLGLYAVDSDGTERIMPVPADDEESEKILSMTSIKQLPTGEELFKILQGRKRDAESSDEILFGGSAFQELFIHYADGKQQTESFSPLRLTVYIAAFSAFAVAAAVIIINILHREKENNG